MARKSFKSMIIELRKTEPDLRYHEIAERLGCSICTVGNVCSSTGLQAGWRSRRDFSDVLKLGYAARRAGLTLNQIEGMANARHA